MTALGLYVLAAHAAGDFPLQPDWMAARKLSDPAVRALHVLVYTAAHVPVALVAPWSTPQVALYLGAVATTHFVVDSRRWAAPTDALPGRPIWFDQAYHVITLAITVAIVEATSGVPA